MRHRGTQGRRPVARAAVLTVALCASAVLGPTSAWAAPLRIVAVGASNTSGWLIPESSAYPAVLEAMLRARGVEAEVANAGVPFDTTAAMLSRLDGAVPPGTDIAILQPGGNDLRFFGTREARAANVAAMMKRLRARGIAVVVYDEDLPLSSTFDGIHFTPAAHGRIAATLLPRVLALASGKREPRSVGGRTGGR